VSIGINGSMEKALVYLWRSIEFIYAQSRAQLIELGLGGYGEGGIRTLVKVTPKQHFQCCAFNRSATSPSEA
jgi:hypothetical protein